MSLALARRPAILQIIARIDEDPRAAIVKPVTSFRHYRLTPALAAPFAAGLFYVALRLPGWLNSPELEDHDSIRYLAWARIFRSGDWRAIVEMSPDAAPLFPFLTAALSLLPVGLEDAARLVSVLSSTATMVAVYLLCKRIGNTLSAVMAILLLAVVSPAFYRMSYSTMTEPLYIALFAWIALVFISTVERPGTRGAVVLGVLVGLAFLTRVEAVLLLPALPLLHLAYAMGDKERQGIRTVVSTNLLVVLTAAVIMAPQIARVSALMDSLALNGRSAWPVILASPDGRSYHEKLTGLDYDDRTLNLHYLQTHPEALEGLTRESGHLTLLRNYATTVILNVRRMHDRQLVMLVGLPVLALSVVGFLASLRSVRRSDPILLVGFVAIALAGPLIYSVTLRHLLILVPFLCIFSARGVVDMADALASKLFRNTALRTRLAVVILLLVCVMPLENTMEYFLQPDDTNGEYHEESLLEPVELVRQFSAQTGRPARVLARKAYLAWLSTSVSCITPYTSLSGLLAYMDGKQLDFLFYEHEHLQEYPFSKEIGSEAWSRHFREIWSSNDREARRSLYAVLSGSSAEPVVSETVSLACKP